MMMQNKVREMLPHYYTRWARFIAQYVSSMRRAITREADQAPSRCMMGKKKGGGHRICLRHDCVRCAASGPHTCAFALLRIQLHSRRHR
jgi:hypothetical protein